MFPYPSGDKLHIGHWYNYAPVDTYARFKRLKGFNVFQPMGFDSFGLPAENFAIEQGVHPKTSIRNNVNKMLEQFDLMYTMYDGIGKDSQPLLTSEPEYYKWTQFLFSLMATEKLLVKRKSEVNWCPKCKTVLANEQVKVDNNDIARCDRCDNSTSIKTMSQWFFKASAYKDRLLKDIDSLDYPLATINAQKNWIKDLKDWCVSRQRYWGCPIPVVYKDNVPSMVPQNDFPWLLPEDVDFVPDGQSPLARSAELKKRVNDKFGPEYTPEYDTMDTFVCSSYYWLQYLALEKGDSDGVSSDIVKEWMPVDLYVGGSEHACMHLIYARFVTKVMHNNGILPCDEPFKRLIHQGVITRDGVKMSKSKGNAVDPTEYVQKYGSDAFRMALMFMGPYDQGGEFDDAQLVKMKWFLDQVFIEATAGTALTDNAIIGQMLDRLAENIEKDIEKFRFNICIANFMKFLNIMHERKLTFSRDQLKDFLVLLWSFAPKTVDNLWKQMVFAPETPLIRGYPKYKSASVSKKQFLVIKINDVYKGRVDMGEHHNLGADALVEKASSLLRLEKYDSIKFQGEGRVLNFIVKEKT